MLTSLTDVDGYRVNYEHYTSSPYRVRRITEFGRLSLIHISQGLESSDETDVK